MKAGDPTESDPTKDMEFLASMPEEEYSKYRGEWVAVANAEIVAHGKDPRRVHREGRKACRGEPLMDYVYADYTEVPLAYYDPDR